MCSRKVIPEPLASAVFGHSNAHDRIVKSAGCRDLAIIAQLDLRCVSESSFGDPRERPFRLGFAQGDSLRAYAEMFRRVNDEAAPATTNVQQTLPGWRHNLRQKHFGVRAEGITLSE